MKNSIENALKRFLRKNGGFKESILISFLITGSLAYGNEEEILKNKQLLNQEISNAKNEINTDISKLDENKKLKEKELEQLLFEADFWGKPLYTRYQFFFNGTHTDTGDKNDETSSEFKETIDAVNDYYGLTNGGTINGYDAEGLIKEFNGVVVDTSVYSDTIDIGANVLSLTPELPTINPNVAVDVSIPNIELGSLPGNVSIIQPTLPSVSVPTPNTPPTPNGVTVSVDTPSPVEEIAINTPTITAPTPPSEKEVVVVAPTTPESFTPTQVTPPTVTIPAPPTIITPETIDYPGFGSSISDVYDYWGGGNYATMIDQISITSGKFKATSGEGAFISGYTGEGGISATSSTIVNGSPSGTIPTIDNSYNSLSRNYFFGIRNSAFIQWDPSVEISWFTGNGSEQLIYMETSTTSRQTLDTLNAAGLLSASLYTEVDGYKTLSGLSDNGGGAAGINLHNNMGDIYLGDSDTRYTATTTISRTRLSVFNNEGTITGLNINNGSSGVNGSSQQVVHFNTPDTSAYQKWIYGNGATGKINLYGEESIAMYYTAAYSNNYQQHVETAFINNGEINLYGINSSGVLINELQTLNSASGFYLNTPVNISSDGSRGVYIAGDISDIPSSHAIVRATIGEEKNDTTGVVWNDIETNTNIQIDSNSNIAGNSTDTVDNAIGVMYTNDSNSAKIQTPNITLEKFANNSIGIYSTDGKLSVDNGNIYIKGGTNNVGILSNSGGDIDYTGNINISSSSLATTGGTVDATSTMAAYIVDQTLDISGDIDVVSKDSVSLYSNNGVINVSGDISINSSGEDVVGLYAQNNGVIDIDRTSLSGNTEISITGDTDTGVALYSENGGVINAQNNYIKVTDGTAGVVSTGSNSHIDLTSGVLDYTGSGYAAYSEGIGTIDLSDAKVILGGSATAFDLDLAATNPITLDSTSNIHVTSDDVVVFNLKNASGLSTSGLESSIETAIGSSLGGVTLSGLVSADTGIDKYKIAAVDGGTIAIGDLDKTGTGVAGETAAQSDGHFYYNRFLGQRLVATANNSTISAILNNTQDDNFNDQVVGLEMNSSSLAVHNGENRLELTNGSTVIADRNDSGAGAIGIFINYGQVDILNGNSINVEMETSNTANDGGIGVYSVNGSQIANYGDINVGGAGIGILAMAYREDPTTGTPIVDEFGSAALDQGEIFIFNNGNIALNDDGGVGIYSINNSANSANDADIYNLGSITVGNSSTTNSAVGIYGSKSTINNFGSITVGDGGVGIYATDNSDIGSFGTLNLGKDGIGVFVDENSTISATDTLIVNDTSGGTDVTGKTALIYQGGSGISFINIDIDTTNLTKGTAIYLDGQNTGTGMPLFSSGTLSIGDDSVGIYAVNSGYAANSGVIELVQTPGGTIGSTDSVGMYTNNGTVANIATIKVLDSSSIGMVGSTANGAVVNDGTIDLNADNATGMFITDSGNLDLSGSINFNGSESIGVYSEKGSTVNLSTSTSFVEDNENSNILVYAKDSTVNNGGTLTVDGVAIPTTVGAENNKTVGIYLENDGVGSKYASFSGGVDVSNQAIGIYSKESNTLEDVNITSKDTGTTGIYLDGGGTINGTVNADGTGGIGVYGVDGEVIVNTTGLSLNTGASGTTEKGTGMYLTDGAYASGGTITVNNQSTIDNIGVYYAKGSEIAGVAHDADLSLVGDSGIGIYAADGIDLTNNSDISSSGTTENIGVFVSEGSKYISNGDINLGGVDDLGIYVEDGDATSNGLITLSGTPTSTAIGIGITGKSVVGKTATVNNAGTITTNSNLGMYIAGDGNSSGTNIGSIIATTGTGVYIDGSSTTGIMAFDGSGGTIKSDVLGMYLEDTKGGTVTTTGTLDIGVGGVGVYSNGSTIDFEIDSSKNSTGETTLAVKNNSIVDDVTINSGTDSVGIFVIDDTVAFNKTGSLTNTITTSGNNTGTSVGIYLAETIGTVGSEYNLGNVDVDAKDGIGIYLGDDGTVGSNIKFSGTVSTSGSTGIYVPTNGSLITDTSTFNVDGGTGIYIDGGTVDVGNNGLTTFNFGSNGGIAIYNNGGSITLGSNLTSTGGGSLVGTNNGNIDFSGNISVGEGGTGLLGSYDSTATGAYNITNEVGGTIVANNGGIAIAAINDPSSPYVGGSSIIAENQGTISVSGESSVGTPSVGIYTEVGGISNTGTISVGSNGVGIYTNYGVPSTESIDNQDMVMTGTDGIGMYLKGGFGGVVGNNITSTGSSNTGVILSDVGTTGTLNLGNITLNDDSLGVLVSGASTSTIDGTISVGDGSTKNSIGLVSTDGADTTLGTSTTIAVGDKGIGVYVDGASSTATVSDASNVTVGVDGIYFLNNGGTLNILNGSIVADNNIGIYSNGGTLNYTTGTVTAKNGGIGMYIKGSAPTGSLSIDVQAGRADKYSIGAYYDGVVSVTGVSSINQTGVYTIGLGFDNGSTYTTSSAIVLGGSSDQVGIISKGYSTIALNNDIILGSGDNNIGIYSEDSSITVNGDISVASPSTAINPADPLEFSSVGTFLKGNSLYFGTGDITLGSNAIGVFGNDLTAGAVIQQTGDITGGSGSLGVYGEGTGTGNESIEVTGDISLDSGSTIGVFGKGTDVEVTGDMNIGADTSVGVVSIGNGDINYSGDSTIDNALTTGSIGIYKKDGAGNVNVTGDFNVGEAGYGIYVQQSTGQSSNVLYSGDMVLGEAGIGIYSEGTNVVTNNGTISVGATTPGSTPTDIEGRLNSVGMYLSDGSTGINNGTLNTDEQYSLGVYASGVGTTFSNTGTMNVSNGGIGVLARNGAVVTNEVGATINLNSTGANSSESVGMAAHTNSSIINNGTITVSEGVGMFVGAGGELTNTGTINVGNGTGIDGTGTVSNSGTINVTGTGSATNTSGGNNVSVGSVNIASDGTVTINENYVSIGGTLQTQGNLVVDGSYVDVTTGTPVFSADSVAGEVEIMGDFATTGNGITYQIKDFVTTASGVVTGTTLTPITSPLFLSKVANDGSLIIVKRPYSDLTIGDQFVEMEDGLDDVLENDPYGDDGMALKSLNAYLEDLPTSEFEAESTRALSEMRGDIYSTIQQRMSDVERSFDSSFDELLNSYNTSRDVGKFSLITTDRDYNDPTVGVTDYDLTSIGFLFMREYEGNSVGAKSGYTIGFTSNDFDFDDEGSEEKIYSVRVGAHKVTPIKDYKTRLITKVGVGYNRHETDRDFLLDQKYENEARYNSYSINLDNKLSHSLILDLSSRLDVYGALNLEAAKVDDFDESGTLELDVDSNDYLSSKAVVGVEGSKKFHIGNKISLKFSGGVNYSYEFADNVNDNSAKISESDEGYYDLISPDEEKGILTGLVGITLEKGNHMGITLGYEVEDDHSRDEVSESYELRLNYKF